jgi:hypothetical protein
MFEDTIEVIRNRKSKKYMDNTMHQKRKITANNDPQNTIQKTLI